ncbi:hypothetical protein [Bacillus inaquosorum]|uniref:hypothetical protein n=1 Tax=Bacillus inaquosorum TaxID=483913 RepID=UPI002DB5EE56|nr:hypothetical protein [Bacillus inaquosorum]MEC2062716.1 hypothetical protein [Bacillus inaquosorum]MEC2086141.1 hypothetical protein [Bacillus inaquosorum]
MSAAITFSQYIDSDYDQFQLILLNKLNFDCNVLSTIKELHQNIYQFKELVYVLDSNNQSNINFTEAINGFIEFVWLLSMGKYKTASMSLRGAMENFAKGLTETNFLPTDEKFSQNIDRSIKEIVNKFGRKPKEFAKVFSPTYRDDYKQYYWDLCDIVHSRDNNYSTCAEYLEQVIEKHFDEDKLKYLVSKGNIIIEYSTIILMISEYTYLSNAMNPIKFNYILDNFSEPFNLVRPFL